MSAIGVSLPASLLNGCPSTEAQRVLTDTFGSVEALLDALKAEGVSSVELRDAHSPISPAEMISAVETIKRAGLNVSLHILFEDTPFAEYEHIMRPVFDAALKGRNRLNLTVHLHKSAEITAGLLSEWRFGSGITVSLENMRVKKPENGFMFLESVYRIVSDTGSDGITFDMGHYAFNRDVKHVPQDSVPDASVLAKVIHTHIHSYMYGQTHFPLFDDNTAVRGYVRALKAIGYTGIYDLELEPERYIGRFDPAEGIIGSVRVLKRMLSDD